MGRPETSAEEKAARGDRLRQLRERLKADNAPGGSWTQDDVAVRAGIQRTSYVKMEGGKSAMTGKSVAELARVFELELREFDLFLTGVLTVEAALQHRVPLAAAFIEKLDARQKLKTLIRKHPDRWHLATVIRALSGETYVRENEDEPEVGWASLLDAIESRQIDETEERGEDAARVHARTVGPRPPIPGYTSGGRRK